MLFVSIFSALMVGFVWGWYRNNSGKENFDDWDKSSINDWPRDWHKHE